MKRIIKIIVFIIAIYFLIGFAILLYGQIPQSPYDYSGFDVQWWVVVSRWGLGIPYIFSQLLQN